MPARNASPEAEYLPIGEVAKLFNVTATTVRNWEKDGKLTAIRTPGNQRRFRRAQVEALLSGERVA